MTWASVYLIKSAVTAGRLAETAKAHGIPLIGDWRYAAKLLRRQATPAGKAHYERVVGFPTEEERKLLAAQLKESRKVKSLEDLREHQQKALVGAGLTPEGAKFLLEAGRTQELPPGKGVQALRAVLEAGVYKLPGGKYQAAVPGVRQMVVPIPGLSGLSSSQIMEAAVEGKKELATLPYSRIVHTHPEIARAGEEAQSVYAMRPEYRRLGFGHVLPSSDIDLGLLPSLEMKRRTSALAALAEKLQRQGTKSVALSAELQKAQSEYTQWLTHALMSPEGQQMLAPRHIASLDEHIDVLKRLLAEKGRRMAGDVSFLRTPHATHAIRAPHSGLESVFKGGGGQLRRIYFRKGPK